MKDILAAGRYAQALFEIARLTHQDEEIAAELESLSTALKGTPSIEKVFANPALKAVEKREFLGRIFQGKMHPFYGTLLDFFTILFRKNRFHLIHEIASSFRRIADEAEGQGKAQLRTAAPLDPALEAAIVSRLEKIAGARIVVEKEVDPTLLGGVVIKVKNKIIDGSVRSKIHSLKEQLTKIRAV